MRSDEIEKIIRSNIKDCEVKVKDDGAGHYEAIVISDNFKEVGTLNRHKMVFNTLGSLVGNEIHALSLRTFTIDEFND